MRKILILAMVLATAWNAAAQSEELTKQMEVTRAYVPRVGQAAKLPIEPDMTDTVRMKPRIEYSITSTASSTSFETRPYAAATMGPTKPTSTGPLYLKAGVGVPFVTQLDLYYTPRIKPGKTFGMFANHAGSYSRILNDMGVEADANEITNGAGLWGSKQWKRYLLEGDAMYDNRRYNPYGVANVSHEPESSAMQQRDFMYDRRMHRFSLGLARGRLSFGDNFGDLSRFNFRVATDVGLAHFSRGLDERQYNLNTRFTAARMYLDGKHGFEAVLDQRMASRPHYLWDGENGSGAGGGSALTISLMPRYLLVSGVWSLRAGIDARYIRNKENDEEKSELYQNYLRVAPSFELRANIAGGAFVPFVNYTSRVEDGNAEALSRRNPYVTGSGTTAWVNDARAGFSGDLSDVFSYRLSGGVSLFSDYQLFVGRQVVTLREAAEAPGVSYPPMWFEPVAVDGTRYTVGGEVRLQNLGGFEARIYGNWNRFEFRGNYPFAPVGDLPRYDGGVEVSWAWHDMLKLHLGVEMTGERNYVVRSGRLSDDGPSRYSTGVIAPVADVTFGAEVRVARDLWVFLEGENLADQVLYPYPHYRGLGASVLGGVKIVF